MHLFLAVDELILPLALAWRDDLILWFIQDKDPSLDPEEQMGVIDPSVLGAAIFTTNNSPQVLSSALPKRSMERIGSSDHLNQFSCPWQILLHLISHILWVNQPPAPSSRQVPHA